MQNENNVEDSNHYVLRPRFNLALVQEEMEVFRKIPRSEEAREQHELVQARKPLEVEVSDVLKIVNRPLVVVADRPDESEREETE